MHAFSSFSLRSVEQDEQFVGGGVDACGEIGDGITDRGDLRFMRRSDQ